MFNQSRLSPKRNEFIMGNWPQATGDNGGILLLNERSTNRGGATCACVGPTEGICSTERAGARPALAAKPESAEWISDLSLLEDQA
jgi:hypothetical protein